MMHLLKTKARKATGNLALTLSMLMMCGGAALAQDTTENSPATPVGESPVVERTRPFRVRIGGFLPSNGDTQEDLGTNFISYGIGYDILKFRSFLPGTVEIYVDYFDRIKDKEDGRRLQATFVGGGLFARYDLDPDRSLRDNRGRVWLYPYAGVGGGVYWARVKQRLSPNDLFSPNLEQRTNRTTFGGKALIGAELANGVFGEAEYSFLPEPSIFGEDVVLSGGQLRIGYRF